MKVNWIVASGYQLDAAIESERLKSVGPIWGSWKTWRACDTDNVISWQLAKSQELIRRAFQAVCNFYVPRQHYQDLGRPLGIKLFEGAFDQDVEDLEDIIAMHLAADVSDIVLLLGFDLSQAQLPEDRLQRHLTLRRHKMIQHTIESRNLVQWVAVDHPKDFDQPYQNLTNLTRDTMENALQLLI